MTMRILMILSAFCAISLSLNAQQIANRTREALGSSEKSVNCKYNGVPMSKTLMELNDLQQTYTINFIYDELEDFRVTTNIEHQSVPDAIRQMIGFYPIRVTETGKGSLFVECIQKTSSRYKGTVIEERGQPVAYANIALLSPHDSTLLAGGVSNEGGHFVIPCEASHAMARISHIGYQTVYRMCHPSEASTIRMRQKNQTLKGVTVRGQMPILRREAATVIFDTRHIAGAADATDLLRYAPGVLLTEAGIQLFGTSGIILCINGKEQCMGQKEMLQMLMTLPASDVERIEITQTPGAKYAAAGHAGMVNLILKQEGNDYIGGVLGYVHAQSEDHGDEAIASVTYNKGKVSTSLNLAATWDNTRYLETNAVSFTDNLRYGNDHGRIGNENYSLRWQLDYSISDKLDFGAYVMYADGNRTLAVDGGYDYEPGTTYSVSSITTQTRRKEYRKTWAANVNASQKLNNKDARIDYNLDYYRMRMSDGRHSLGNNIYAEQPQEEDTTEFNYQNHIALSVDNYSAKADFSYEGFKLGLQYAYTHSYRDLGYSGVGAYSRITNTYDERLLTGYAEYARKLGDCWTAEAGARYEHLWTEAADQPMANATAKNYGKLFPSLHVAFKPHPSHAFSWTLSSRITRPNILHLNSASVWSDVNHVSFGNQDLKSSCRYKATMDYTYRGRLSFELYYAYEPDRIDPVYMVERQVTYNSWDNVTREYDFGLHSFYSFDRLNWMQATLTLGIGYSKTVRRQDRTAAGIKRRFMYPQVEDIACQGDVQVALFFDARRKWTAHLHASYRSAEKDVARQLHARYAVDAGMQYRFWKDRMTLGLACRNLIASRLRGTEYLSTTTMDFDNKLNYRQLRLTLTYNWGTRLRHRQHRHESDKMQERIINDF